MYFFHQIWTGLLLWTRAAHVRVPGKEEERDRRTFWKSLGGFVLMVLVVVFAFLLAQLSTSAKRNTSAHVLTPRELLYADLSDELKPYLRGQPQGFPATSVWRMLHDIDNELEMLLDFLDDSLRYSQGQEEGQQCLDSSWLASTVALYDKLHQISELAQLARSRIRSEMDNETGGIEGRALHVMMLAEKILFEDLTRWHFYLDAFRSHGLHFREDYLQNCRCDKGWTRRVTDQLLSLQADEKGREKPRQLELMVPGTETGLTAGGSGYWWLPGAAGVALASLMGTYIAFTLRQNGPGSVPAL
jgi:hypothetical protein